MAKAENPMSQASSCCWTQFNTCSKVAKVESSPAKYYVCWTWSNSDEYSREGNPLVVLVSDWSCNSCKRTKFDHESCKVSFEIDAC